MTWTIDTAHPGRYICVAVRGEFSLEDVEKMNMEIISHPAWRPGRDLLFDDTELDTANIYTPDIESIADLVAAMSPQFARSRMAIVVSTDVQFGLARQLQMITESRTATRFGVFRKHEDAEGWLEE